LTSAVVLFGIFLLIGAIIIRWPTKSIHTAAIVIGVIFTVILLTIYVFHLSRSQPPAPTASDWCGRAWRGLDVNHRNSALIVAIAIPSLTGFYAGSWWDASRTIDIVASIRSRVSAELAL